MLMATIKYFKGAFTLIGVIFQGMNLTDFNGHKSNGNLTMLLTLWHFDAILMTLNV